MIHDPRLRPRAGLVETLDESGRRVYAAANDRVSAIARNGAEMTEALELILSGETGEEGDDEARA